MSHFELYSEPSTSGAMYNALPTLVLCTLYGSENTAVPKSATFTTKLYMFRFSISRFSGFKSR